MMRIYTLPFILCLTLCTCRNRFEYNIPLNPVDCFYYDNFRYPENLDEYMDYLECYQNDFPNIPIVRDFRSCKDDLALISNDSVFIIYWKKDTLDYVRKKHPCNLDDLPDERWNMSHFFRVSMQTSASKGYNVATVEMMSRFNQGLYDLVAEKIPAFRENRKRRIDFSVVLIEYSDNNLHKVCESDPFDLKNHILLSDLAEYVSAFAAKEGVEKIIFYYMYDK